MSAGDSRLALGVDIGGTKIAVGLVDAQGRLRASTQLPTESRRGLPDAGRRVRAAAEALLAAGGCVAADLAGIGLGCAGPVHPVTGIVSNPFTLPGWEGGNLLDALGREFGLPVRLENDADVALLGEAWVGAAAGESNAAMLTFGTGVGGAVLTGGRLLRGTGQEHPELGHLPVDGAGPECYCGLRGCLESLASGPALAAAGRSIGCADAAEVFVRAEQGDAAATRIIQVSVNACRTAAATLVHAFLPRTIVLGGSIMEAHWSWYEPALRTHLAELKLFPQHVPRLVPAALGNRAGMVGAAALVLGPGVGGPGVTPPSPCGNRAGPAG